MSHDSKFWLYRNILNLARLYKNNVLYVPCFMDFRGRVYPMVSYLNYQASDIARSLFCFKNSTGVDINYLYIYLANAYGKNRLTRASRIKWAKDNYADIYNLYINKPGEFKDKYLVNSAEPAQFVSCLLSIAKYNINSKHQLDLNSIRTPVLFDATCSGMQHLSALTCDMEIATYVNIIAGDEPEDFYRKCAEAVIEVIKKHDDHDLRSKLLSIRIDRKFIKQSVMTIPYNVKLESMTKQLTDKFETFYVEVSKDTKKLYFKIPAALTVDNKEHILTGREAGLLGSIVYKTVLSIIKPVNDYRNYISKIIKIFKLLNKPIF